MLAAGGQVTGVIPAALVAKEIAHSGLTELRVVASMHERKGSMADRCDAFSALPGGWGAREEFFEVLTWGQLGLHRKPCGLLNVQGYCDFLLAFVKHSFDEGFVRREYWSMIWVSDSPEGLLERLAGYDALSIEKWIDRAATRLLRLPLLTPEARRPRSPPSGATATNCSARHVASTSYENQAPGRMGNMNDLRSGRPFSRPVNGTYGARLGRWSIGILPEGIGATSSATG